MTKSDLASAVKSALTLDREAFQDRVHDETEFILEEIDAGTFDNPQGIVGLEFEFYAVASSTAERWTNPRRADAGALSRLPRRLLEYVGFETELGLHNAEMSTSPDPFNAAGLKAQEQQVAARLDAARSALQTEGRCLVSDGLWTVPPTGETAAEYLTDSVEIDGVRIASNMSESVRYHGMSNADLSPRMEIDAPHVSVTADTVLPESLITSIQPHYQVPRARDLPEYMRYALRIAGPLLALAVNSPLFPPSLYDEGTDPDAALADGWDEHRICVFESVLNGEEFEKVRFPRDIETAEQAVDRIAADETLVPTEVSGGERFDDQFAHFKHKHGTYWRWVRPVFGGATRSAANARVEFRPLPAQPTIRDTIAFQAAVVGLLVGLERVDHPAGELAWERARANFYAAAEDGLSADLTWITADGERTTDTAVIIEDILTHADTGLAARGIGPEERNRYLEPLQNRLEYGMTPADWKRDRVRAELDAGADFETALRSMTQEYVANQRDTMYTGTFTEWL